MKDLFFNEDATKELEKDSVLVFDTAAAYAERTGGCYWDDLSITEQRKELEQYAEEHPCHT